MRIEGKDGIVDTPLDIALHMCAKAKHLLEHEGGTGLIEKYLVLDFLQHLTKVLKEIK